MPRPATPPPKPVRSVSPGSGPPGLVIGLVVVLVIALIGGLVWAATRGGGSLVAEGSPNALPEGGGVVVPLDPDPDLPEVHIYEDFQCPFCHDLEENVGDEVSSMLADGEITARYTMMSFLDQSAGNTASSRSANAALCADDQGEFPAYHEGLYEVEPADPAQGWTDEELVSIAESAGIGGQDLDVFAGCVEEQAHADYVDDMAERASQDGVDGTPRVFIDGEAVTEDELGAMILGQSTLTEVLAAHQR